MPTLAARLPTQGPLAVALSALGIAGYLGLWFVPATLPWLWALLLGVSQASFPLALTMIGLARVDAGRRPTVGVRAGRSGT
jgi:CP family cyanate transporter-like MFS transporter